jgi:hypothetical protein
MKVNVIGKNHISGTSKKTGKPFDLNVVHITCKKNGVDGLAAENIMLDPKTYPIEGIQVVKPYLP